MLRSGIWMLSLCLGRGYAVGRKEQFEVAGFDAAAFFASLYPVPGWVSSRRAPNAKSLKRAFAIQPVAPSRCSPHETRQDRSFSLLAKLLAWVGTYQKAESP